MPRPALLVALLTALVLTGCQSGTNPAADSATAENKVLVENPKYQARHRQVSYVDAGRVD